MKPVKAVYFSSHEGQKRMVFCAKWFSMGFLCWYCILGYVDIRSSQGAKGLLRFFLANTLVPMGGAFMNYRSSKSDCAYQCICMEYLSLFRVH